MIRNDFIIAIHYRMVDATSAQRGTASQTWCALLRAGKRFGACAGAEARRHARRHSAERERCGGRFASGGRNSPSSRSISRLVASASAFVGFGASTALAASSRLPIGAFFVAAVGAPPFDAAVSAAALFGIGALSGLAGAAVVAGSARVAVGAREVMAARFAVASSPVAGCGETVRRFSAAS